MYFPRLPIPTARLLAGLPDLGPAGLVPDKWRTLYALNLMVGVVDGFRWALLGAGHPPTAPRP